MKASKRPLGRTSSNNMIIKPTRNPMPVGMELQLQKVLQVN